MKKQGIETPQEYMTKEELKEKIRDFFYKNVEKYLDTPKVEFYDNGVIIKNGKMVIYTSYQGYEKFKEASATI